MDESIVSQITDRHYKPDPETEALIPYGSLIRNGMVILHENHMVKVDLDEAYTGVQGLTYALMNNRWSKVTLLTNHDSMIWFVSHYMDGSKIQRKAHLTDAWFVKRDSIQNEKILRFADAAMRRYVRPRTEAMVEEELGKLSNVMVFDVEGFPLFMGHSYEVKEWLLHRELKLPADQYLPYKIQVGQESTLLSVEGYLYDS